MKILAAVDRSGYADAVIHMVKRISMAETSRVLLLHAAPREPDLLGQQLHRKVIADPVPEELRDRRQLLDRLFGELTAAAIPCETLLVRGKSAATIVDEARRWGADLIVVGSHGRSMLYKRFLGSVSEEVLESRRFPVLVVPLSESDSARPEKPAKGG